MVRASIIAAALAACACSQDGLTDPAELVVLDENYFSCNVEPVLIQGCGLLACHGNDDRPYTVYGRSRHRLAQLPWTTEGWKSPLSTTEHELNYENAIMFIGSDGQDALLLRKPLEAEAGGYFHRGKDLFGSQDVFRTAGDPEYLTIAAWIDGATEPSPCDYEAEQTP